MIKLALAGMLWAAPAAAQTRPPAVAGQFYPAGAEELDKAVDGYLAAAPAPAKLPGSPLALVVPHAGYEFSAPVAAYAYKTMSGAYDTVVVLGSAHTVPVDGAALYAKGAFATPLGPVPVDAELAARLLKDSSLFQDDPRAHSREHSVEVQLPFLIKRLKPGWKLLPLVMNSADPEVSVRVGQALAQALKGRKALIIASSDLSHYPSADLAAKVDKTTLKSLERLDPQFFWLSNRIMTAKNLPGLDTTWCGEAAVLAAMTAARGLGADQGVLLRYANSGTSAHADQSRGVGYAAMAMVRSGRPQTNELILDAGQKKTLLALARDAIKAGLTGRKPEPGLSADPVLNLPAAVFVTLTEAGRLRGCIGTTEARATLRDAVASSAYSAGFEDHRFPPVSAEDIPSIHIEISMLSPTQAVPDHNRIIPKRHGVILSQGRNSGLFLPQVWEQLPGKKDFLSELCSQKAGLPRDCWKDPKTAVSVFTVGAFAEPKATEK